MNICIGCGYDLRGSDPGPCPECGWERPAGTIDLLVTTHERVFIRMGIMVLAFVVFLLVVLPFRGFSGLSPLLIALGVPVSFAVTVLSMRLLTRAHRGPIGPGQQDAVRFTPDGVLCRQLSSWSSLMPYKELDGFVLRRRMFGTSWRFRVTFRLLGISFPFVRGRVNLDDQTAAHLRSEIPARIAQAKRSRQP